jgi:hypothetical protein
MIKILISFFLVLSFIGAPLGNAHAATGENTTVDLMLQLGALRSYLARTYPVPSRTALTPDELRESIKAGALWLTRAQEEDGHFKYEYVPYGDTYRNDDNIVRQAGALYALGEIVRHTDRDALGVGGTMQKSIAYFEDLSREGTFRDETFRCIVKSDASSRCPLGATALALVGTLSYVESNPREAKKYAPLISDFSAYILSMQKENGGFRDLYAVGSTKQSDKESSFSNGEALLALVRTYMYAPEPEVKDAIDRAFTYLTAQPYDPNLYLWIMAATKDMYTLWPSSTYTTYAKGFTTWRVGMAASLTNPTRNYCAYTEGLASALSFISPVLTNEESVRLQTELATRNRNHHALQLTEGDAVRLVLEEGVPRLGTLTAPEAAIGGFLTGDAEPTQRIDFTQHCITGYLHTLIDVEKEAL